MPHIKTVQWRDDQNLAEVWSLDNSIDTEDTEKSSPPPEETEGRHERYNGVETVSNPSSRRSYEEEQRGVTFVELRKKEGASLGLVISGGIDKECPPRVSYLRPGGIAHRSDQVMIGDYITAVNGARVRSLRHDQVVNLLKTCGNDVLIELEYLLPNMLEKSTFSVLCKRVEVTLVREASCFGIVLRGGMTSDLLKCRSLVVKQIRPGSSAHRDGTIKIGDRLLAVNGVDVTQCTLAEALSVLKRTEGKARLLLEYDVSVLDVVQNATGPLLVEIDKTPGSELGISLAVSNILGPGKHPVLCIESVTPASLADRCGALHVGDHLLSIDDTGVEQMTVEEADQLLKFNASDTIHLELLPFPRNSKNLKGHGRESSETTSLTSLQSYGTSMSLKTQVGSAVVPKEPAPHMHPRHPSNTVHTDSLRRKHTEWGTRNPLSAHSSLSSLGTLGRGRSQAVTHTELAEIKLQRGSLDGRGMKAGHCPGFGITLGHALPGQEDQPMVTPPIISHIQPNSPADKSGIVQESDRLLEVNGQSLQHCTLPEAIDMLETSGVKVILTVEFDVAESIIPSSGVFAVKLAKRGGGIGITISASGKRQDGEPLIIADVKKGSVAHRTGTIQPGDKLVAIDNVRMDTCTVEDAAQVLQNSEDIVKLRIQKDEIFADEPDPSSIIAYTVELPKFSGPLGITISGTDEPFDPILISSISEGSVAHGTGAIHVGDRIIAINGHSLRGRPLSDAIQLLQEATDTVTLKITRPAASKSRRGGSGKSQDSVDSALESWHSSGSNNTKTPTSRPTSQELPHTSQASSSATGSHSDRVSHSDRLSHHSDMPSPVTATAPTSMLPTITHTTFNDLDNKLEMRTTSSSGTPTHPGSLCSADDEWSRDIDELDKLRNSDLVINEAGLDDNPGEVYSGGAEARKQVSPVEPEHSSESSGPSDTSFPAVATAAAAAAAAKASMLPPSQNSLMDELSAAMDELSAIGGLTAITAVTDCFGRGRTESLLAQNITGITPLSAAEAASTKTSTPNAGKASPTPPQDADDDTVVTAEMHLREVEEQLQNIFTPTPMEIFKIRLHRRNIGEDFGLGLSDGVYEKGVYISALRPNGPAQRCGVLRHYDRLLQVNGVQTKELECSQVVSLVSQAKHVLELVVSRNPLAATRASSHAVKFSPMVELLEHKRENDLYACARSDDVKDYGTVWERKRDDYD